MASGGSAVVSKDARDSQSSSKNVSVILRVKRKREEDPLDALGTIVIKSSSHRWAGIFSLFKLFK